MSTIDSIYSKVSDIHRAIKEQKEYGLWQLCPKCGGEKHLEGGSYNPDGSLTINRTCPLCNGEGKLVRPGIKKEDSV